MRAKATRDLSGETCGSARRFSFIISVAVKGAAACAAAGARRRRGPGRRGRTGAGSWATSGCVGLDRQDRRSSGDRALHEGRRRGAAGAELPRLADGGRRPPRAGSRRSRAARSSRGPWWVRCTARSWTRFARSIAASTSSGGEALAAVVGVHGDAAQRGRPRRGSRGRPPPPPGRRPRAPRSSGPSARPRPARSARSGPGRRGPHAGRGGGPAQRTASSRHSSATGRRRPGSRAGRSRPCRPCSGFPPRGSRGRATARRAAGTPRRATAR